MAVLLCHCRSPRVLNLINGNLSVTDSHMPIIVWKIYRNEKLHPVHHRWPPSTLWTGSLSTELTVFVCQYCLIVTRDVIVPCLLQVGSRGSYWRRRQICSFSSGNSAYAQVSYSWMFVFRVRTGPGNSGKYQNFSPAFSRTGKSLKMVGGPGKS